MQKSKFEVKLLVADILFVVKFVGGDEEICDEVVNYFEPFVVGGAESGDAVVRVRVELGERMDVRLNRSCEGKIELRREGLVEMELDVDASEVRAWVSGRLLFIRMALLEIVSLFIIKNDGVFLHASSVLGRSGGYVFFGPQGSGKTTMGRILKAPVMAEDNSVLRVIGDEVVVYTSPFERHVFGGVGKIKSRVKGLFLLRHGKRARVDGLTENGVRVLMDNLKPNIAYFRDNEELMNRLFVNVSGVVDLVRVSELTFALNSDVWRVLDE